MSAIGGGITKMIGDMIEFSMSIGSKIFNFVMGLT